MVLLSRCSFVLRRSIRAAPQTVAFRRQFPSRSYSNGPIRDEPEVEDHDWESALPVRPDYEERERRLIEGERLRKESQVARRQARSEEREQRLNAVKQEKLAFQLKLTESWDKFCQVPKLPLEIDKGTEYVGFFGKKRTVSKHLSFADLTLPSGEVVQLCSRRDDDAKRHESFGKIPSHSPVLVRIDETAETEVVNGKRSLVAREIQMLNEAPEKLIVTKETRFPAEKRHLQIRFHAELNARLRFRSWLKAGLTQGLVEKGFMDVETPTLFKSTPEGAREFLVPTRTQGKAYALTQSPQQYKQALMATGVGRYMQWARCYRDEDSRADRQPEFTQLDMEWAFANAENVKKDVTDIVLKTLTALRPAHSYQDINDERVPLISKIPSTPAEAGEAEAHQITHLTFAECIEKHGIDKPDLRIPGQIHQLSIPEEAKHFVGMISNLEDPLVEAFVFPLEDLPPNTARKFVNMFMSTLPRPMSQNVDGAPSILIFDSSMPLNGFSSIGPEYEHLLEQAASGRELQDGDLVVFQVREKPRGQFTDASTRIGDMRRLLWQALVDGGLMEKPRLGDPGSLQFVWVTEFPMFKPLDAEEPWQAEAAGAGISACHHPFTAPLAREDFDKLFESPLDAKSGAYDLVLNGTEVGGGSVRNHIADIQEFIMRDVLKMPDSRLKSFNHLFMALRAGCPPHAGFALGFDRLCALLTDTTTVRDVIAFPKTMKGEDPFTKSPGKIDDEKLHPYFLKIGRVRREKVLADSWGRIGAAPGQDVVGKDFSIRDDPKYDAPAVPYWGSTGEGVDPRFKALEEGRVEARGREPVEKLDRPSLDLAEWMKQSAEIVGEEEMAAKTPEELQAEYQEYVASLVAEDALIDEGEMSAYDDEEPPADFQPPVIQNETATSADDSLVEEEEQTPEQEETSVEKDGEKEKK